MSNPNVVFLYSVVAGYIESVFEDMSNQKLCNSIDVIHWVSSGVNSTQHKIKKYEHVKFHPRTELSKEQILIFLKNKSPDIIYVSGWMDSGYLYAIKKYKKVNIDCKVVCGIDDQWEGRLRQHLGRIYFRFFYRKIFDYMWVAGKPQYYFAKKFGYSDKYIIHDLLSANTKKFFPISMGNKKRFVFVGRFDPVKGIDILVDAYGKLSPKYRKEWELLLIGSGEMESYIQNNFVDGIKVIPFLQQDDLIEELRKGGVGCFPSTHEQWGVAIHELALMGYPLLLSSACGACSEFLISGYNGYKFRQSSVADLHTKLLHIIKSSESQLDDFSKRSIILGSRISTEQSIYSLLSVLKN